MRGISERPIQVETNLSVTRLEKRLHADDDDHRQVIHAEAAAEKTIRSIAREHNLRFIFHKREGKDLWTSEPLEWKIPTPSQISLLYQDAPTHKYKDILKQIPAGIEYRRYLEQKYDLSKEWDWIDWISLKTAMKKYDKKGPALRKLLHGCLSTSEVVH